MIRYPSAFLLLFSLTFWHLGISSKHSPQPPNQHLKADRTHKRTSCRDDFGNPVDWWIIYKLSSSREYVFLSSTEAQQDLVYSEAARKGRVITDPDTSPFLRTVYDSQPKRTKDNPPDNRILLAWNDQQPHSFSDKQGDADADDKPKSRNTKHGKQVDDMDPNADETKLGFGKDMMGFTESEAFAHSKGLLGLSVINHTNSTTKATAEFYLITHSFPRTPNGLFDENSSFPVKRRFIESDPSHFFGRNISTPTSKAQHAMCISMEQEVTLKDGQIVFDRNKMDLKKQNLFAILNGLATISPSMTLSNYVPWFPSFKIYHQLFDVRNAWSKDPIKEGDKISTKNVARIIDHDKAKPYKVPDYPTHVFPLWPTTSRVKVDTNGNIVDCKQSTAKKKPYSSLLNASQTNASRCRVWELNSSERQDKGCFDEAIISSTGKDPLRFHLLSKNQLVKADTDDIISSRFIPHHDLKLADSDQQSPKKYFSLVAVNQSWMDHGTFASRSKTLIDTNRLKVIVHFHNNLGVYLPYKDERYGNQKIRQQSMGQDHSKWGLIYPEATGVFMPMAWVTDLNRNRKATKLSTRDHGRGGMFFLSPDARFVAFWQYLNPIIEDNSSFMNADSRDFNKSAQELPGMKLACVEEFNKYGDAMKLRWEGASYRETILVPFSGGCNSTDGQSHGAKLRHETTSYKTPTKGTLLDLAPFWIGSPGFNLLKDTPLRMLRQKKSRQNIYNEEGEIIRDVKRLARLKLSDTFVNHGVEEQRTLLSANNRSSLTLDLLNTSLINLRFSPDKSPSREVLSSADSSTDSSTPVVPSNKTMLSVSKKTTSSKKVDPKKTKSSKKVDPKKTKSPKKVDSKKTKSPKKVDPKKTKSPKKVNSKKTSSNSVVPKSTSSNSVTSKSKSSNAIVPNVVKKKRGRPKGSKNKSKNQN